MKAVLYTRVSTEEQASSGYSLGQQREALQGHCQQNDLEVVAAFEDRSSGAYLDRPGLDTLRDLVADGGVDIVLAQDADRITRDPVHRAYLDDEFIRYGTRLLALDDWGDDSHEGELLKYMKGWVSKGERLKIAERTRRGRLRKAQEGKIPGSGVPPLGFRYGDGNYFVVEEKMALVREIFHRVAGGQSLNEVVRYLERTGAPTPGGGKWHRFTIRTMIMNDTYAGTYHYGKTRKRRTPVAKMVDGEKVYGHKTETEQRPEQEWIAVRVPDSGIPPEIIKMARERIQGNTWTPSTNNGLTWELSGGVGLCGACGSRLRSRSPNNATQKYFYYTCLNDSCPSRKHYRKEELERRVGQELADTLRPGIWIEFVNKTCDRQLEDLRKMHGSPSKSRQRLLKRMGELRAKMGRTGELYTDGDFSKEEYHQKRDSIQDHIEVVQLELSKLDDLDTEIKRIEFLRHLLMAMNPGVDHTYIEYEGIPGGEDERAVDAYPDPPTFFTSSDEESAKKRQDFYRRMGLCVRVQPEDLVVEIANLEVSHSASLS